VIGKPSRNEEEYFAQREAALRRELSGRAAKLSEAEERKLHYMKCPKCGADLEIEMLKGIEVDRCKECQGVWFDANEVEALTKAGEGTAASLFRSLIRSVS